MRSSSSLDQNHPYPLPGFTAPSPQLDNSRDTQPHHRGTSLSPVLTTAASIAPERSASRAVATGVTRTTAPLKGEFLERLYERAVKVQRERREDFDDHMKIALRKGGGQARVHRCRPLAPMAERQLYSYPVELKKQHLDEARAQQLKDLQSFHGQRKGKLDAEEQEAMASRLCNESMAHKKAAMIELVKRVQELPTEYVPPPRSTSSAAAHSSSSSATKHSNKEGASPQHSTSTTLGKFDVMEKQVYQLVLRRRERTLSNDELQQMGQRLCHESLRHKGEELQGLQGRYQFKQRCPSPKLSTEQMKASADRLWKGEK